MDVGVIIRFSGAVVFPSVVAGILYVLNKKTAFGKINPIIKQLIYGIVFGGIAILGTEFGVPLNGAQLNCRDAAVLTAGLLFGAPAGIIAGLIGGVERWIAVAWGVGEFTRVACSVATILAGVLSAIVRKVMFESKKPDWLLSFGIGMVTELLHLSLVFLTNIDQIEKAIQVVQACTVPLIVGNGISVMLSAIVYAILHKIFAKEPKRKPEIAQIIQRWMVITMFLAFLTTQYFVFSFQNRLAEKQTDSLLDLASDEIVEDIRDASDDNLLTLTHLIAKEVSFDNLSEIAEKYGVTEISIISWNGIITDSNISEYLGFDMHSGPQSAEFLCLLGDTEEFVQEYGAITSDNTTMRKYAGAKMKSGFVQVGYDAEAFQNDIDSTVIGITKNRHVGENGFTLILDEKKIIYSPVSSL